MKRRFVKLLSITLLTLCLTGCGNQLIQKAMDQGKLAMANKDYEKAKASYQLALDEGATGDVDKLITIIDSYITATKCMEVGNYKEADKLCSELPEEYKNYPIKDDIDILKTDIAGFIKTMKDTDDKLEKINGLLDEKNYEEAEAVFAEIQNPTSSQNTKKVELEQKLNNLKEEDKKAQEEAEAKRLEEEKKAEQANHQMTEEEARQILASKVDCSMPNTIIEWKGNEGAQGTIYAYKFWVYIDTPTRAETLGFYRVDARTREVYDLTFNKAV